MVTVLSPKGKVADERIIGNVIVINANKPEFGSIAVASKNVSLTSGFVNTNSRVAFINGKVSDLKEVVKAMDLSEGKVLPNYKIIVKESFDKTFNTQSPKINPETKQTVTSDGAEVYRTTKLVDIDSEERDVFLISDKVTTTVTSELEEMSKNKVF